MFQCTRNETKQQKVAVWQFYHISIGLVCVFRWTKIDEINQHTRTKYPNWTQKRQNDIEPGPQKYEHIFVVRHYDSIEYYTKKYCTNQQSHQTNNAKPAEMYQMKKKNTHRPNTMRPIEIKTFGKSLTNCHASPSIFMIIICFFVLWIRFCFHHYCSFFDWFVDQTPPPSPPNSQATIKQLYTNETKNQQFIFNTHIVIVNSSFGNQRIILKWLQILLLVKEMLMYLVWQ